MLKRFFLFNIWDILFLIHTRLLEVDKKITGPKEKKKEKERKNKKENMPHNISIVNV